MFLQVSRLYFLNKNTMMKYTIYLFCLLSIITFSCKEEKVDLSGLEKEIELLKDDINKLQSVISLQNAYNVNKKVVSVTSEVVSDSTYKCIVFADNTMVRLSESIVKSLDFDDDTEEYTIIMSDDQTFIFNSREIIHPTGLVVLTPEIKFMKNTEVSIDFRVNPSNAVFNYDVNSENCQIEFDMANKVNTYSSYVTTPEKCRLTRIEQVVGADGNIKEGQYKAYIRDNNESSAYKYTTALVLSSVDRNGDKIQLSSTTMSLERKMDTKLPVVVIHTENEAEIKDKENWIPGSMTIDGISEFDNYEGTMSIRGRGNSTWGYPKKPYAIKLDNKSKILGMPAHKRWVLLANYIDRTLMRNHIAFEVSKRTELEWTPRGHYVEVVLNDVHLGNYYLCEHIKIDENRVDISEMKMTDIDGEAITGGYLLEFDTYYDEVNKFKSGIRDLPVMIKEPEDIHAKQFEYIQNYIDSIERILYSDTFALSESYMSMIDINSLIDCWFVFELTFNHEPSAPRSSYFYKNRSEVLKAGPVWDFDSWGTFTEQYIYAAKDALWYDALFENRSFVGKVKERWGLLKDSLEKVALSIDEIGIKIEKSSSLNDEMWSLQGKTSPNKDEDLPFKDAVNKMKNSYLQRLEWLDTSIRNLK